MLAIAPPFFLAAPLNTCEYADCAPCFSAMARVTTVMKEIASKWRELSEDERAIWITKALEDKTR